MPRSTSSGDTFKSDTDSDATQPNPNLPQWVELFPGHVALLSASEIPQMDPTLRREIAKLVMDHMIKPAKDETEATLQDVQRRCFDNAAQLQKELKKDWTDDSADVWNHVHDLWGIVQRLVDRERDNIRPTLKRLTYDVSSLKRTLRTRKDELTRKRARMSATTGLRQKRIDEYWQQ